MTLLLRRKSKMAVKVESASGTAETLTAAEGAFNAFEAGIDFAADSDKRQAEGSMSHLQALTGPTSGTAKFSTELIGNGAADLNAALATMLSGCGIVAGSGGVYSLTSTFASMSTLTAGMFIDGYYKRLAGCMGNPVFKFEAGKRVMIDLEYTGTAAAPTDSALIVPTPPTATPMKFLSATLTHGAYTLVVQSLELNLNNNVVLREDGNSASGYLAAVITDRAVGGTITCEGDLAANKNWISEWFNATQTNALSWAVTDSTDTVTFNIPKCQPVNVTDTDLDGKAGLTIEFQGNRSAAADDELTITVS